MILSGTIISLQISVYQTFRLFQCCKKSNKGIPDMSTKTTIKFVSLIRFLNTKIEIFLEFLWFAVEFLRSDYLGYSIRWKKCNETELFAWKSVEWCLCTLICGFESCWIIPYLI